MNNIQQCENCSNAYDRIMIVPILLDCNHTFCRKCVLSGMDLECPKDGKIIHIDSVKTNQELLNLIENNAEQKKNMCKIHSKILEYQNTKKNEYACCLCVNNSDQSAVVRKKVFKGLTQDQIDQLNDKGSYRTNFKYQYNKKSKEKSNLYL